MSRTTARTIADRDAARDALRELFPVGSTVYTVLRHVSRSGMLRSIAVLHSGSDGSIQDVSGLVARATGSKLHQATGGVAMGGAGMDMGFALVHSLGRALYPDGQPCTGARREAWTDEIGEVHVPCPSNDHVNERVPNYAADRVHSDGGYALNHRWV